MYIIFNLLVYAENKFWKSLVNVTQGYMSMFRLSWWLWQGNVFVLCTACSTIVLLFLAAWTGSASHCSVQFRCQCADSQAIKRQTNWIIEQVMDVYEKVTKVGSKCQQYKPIEESTNFWTNCLFIIYLWLNDSIDIIFLKNL